MPTAEKEALVQEMTDALKGVKGMYVADFTGMTVAKTVTLRAKCRAAGVEYKVMKNTLLKLAVHAHGLTQLDEFLEGPTALAFSTESEVEPARVLIEFAKEHEKPFVRAGLIGDKLFTPEEVKQLASLPLLPWASRRRAELLKLLDQLEASILAAVYLHGRAGELGAAAIGEKPFLATDILTYLPEAMREVAEGRNPTLV